MVVEDWEKAALEFDEEERNDEILIGEIEKYLDARKNKKYFITKERKISIGLLDRLTKLKKQYTQTEFVDCIEKSKVNCFPPLTFLVEIECVDCQKIILKRITKTKLLEIISKKINFSCDECIEQEKIIEKLRQKQESENVEEKYRKTVLENTLYYIEAYLNPEYSWNSKIKVWQKIEHLQARGVNFDAISSHIKAMDYQDFLKTPYWKAITQKKMKDANFRCQLCNAEKVQLSTHHRTYSIHGAEVFNLKELIVLCQDCHGKHHDHHKPD